MSTNESSKNITPNEVFTYPPGNHLGLVVRDMDKTMKILSSVLGIGPWVTMGTRKNGFVKLEGLGLGQLCIEIIQPEEGTDMDEFIKTKGEGLHHLCIMVPAENWANMAKRIEEQGFRKLRGGISPEEGTQYCFFEMEAGGLILEIVDDTMPDWTVRRATCV